MNQLSFKRAHEIIELIKGQTIVVYGDVMLDEFVWGSVTRISPEAPVPVVEVQRESVHLGGAANVLANLIELGARSCVVGLIGGDATGERIRRELRQAGAMQIDDALIVDDSRPTTIKTRIIAHNQLVVRADRESRTSAAAEIEDNLIRVLRQAIEKADALIISDYDKGAITPRVLSEILPLAEKRRIPTLIDPKIRNFNCYRPATLVTPNHHEALRLTNTGDDSDAGIAEAGRLIRQQLGCSSVLITRGERGMMLLEGPGQPVYVKTVAREVYDVTGAGDTVIATLAAALAAHATLTEAAALANFAAGVVVGKIGTATASITELLSSIKAASS